ncbi:MAG: hypothetical protein DCC49_13275 [Acidobacteria bacterium]|nr:MAG: hypothetical protein DCC49_13275 [Acidobacteriota bacterium]
MSKRSSSPHEMSLAETRQIHWWYQHNRALAARLLVEHVAPGARGLDAGASAGPNGAWLSAFGELHAVCPHEAGARAYALEAPAAMPAVAGLDELPYIDESFDVIVAISAMHEFEAGDPRLILDEFFRVLRPGGAVCMIEPVWHPADAALTPRGRYFSLPYLIGIGEASGLEIDRSTRANISQRIEGMVAPSAVKLGLPEVSLDDLKWGSRLVRNSLWFIAALERTYLMSRDIGIGAGLVIVARKPRN